MILRIGLLILFSALFSVRSVAQFPTDYFRAPLDIPLVLAGNFGEIRGGHFHAGIDLKTQQREGLPVKAAAVGTVTRVKVSLYGYGKAVYVEHPNGYTTVYAHLQKFNVTLQEYVQQAQYERKQFEVDLYPPRGFFQLSQGEVLGYSGNTGGSGGPHLHFEIRKTDGQVPVNPLLFDFAIRDNIPPIFKSLAAYPMNDTSYVNGSNAPQYFDVTKSGSDYHIKDTTPLKCKGVIAFGTEVIDRLDGAPNRCGVYRLSLNADDELIYQHEMTSIPFDLTRYINTHVDYFAWNKLKKRIQRSWLQPNNRLNVYTTVERNGQVFCSSFDHQLRYTAEDAYGNSAQLVFETKADTQKYAATTDEKFILFKHNTANHFDLNGFKIDVPANALYTDLHFSYRKEASTHFPYSGIHHIHDLYTPLQKYVAVEIPLDTVPTDIRHKLLVISLNEDGELLSPEGGQYHDGNMRFRTRSFGPYAVVADTVAPTIERILQPEQAPERALVFKIEDELAGIEKANGYINGEWALFEWDKKTGEFWHEIPSQHLEKGENKIELAVEDGRGNINRTSITYNW